MSSQTGTTIERTAAADAERRRKALETYRVLLLRNEDPQAGDAERLSESMATLGRQPADLAGDLELAARIPQCEQIAARLPKLRDAAQAAKTAWSAAAAKIDEARRAFEVEARATLAEAQGRLGTAQAAVKQATDAAGELRGLQVRWSALAGPS
jgi:hypothetical protein